ncbi:MAG: AAA family ATPase [Methanobacteriaceae archaeon]|jgi:dephospho-CoA kinase|nr:AAA family ATPase [Methanobacteriaceae archaeon]
MKVIGVAGMPGSGKSVVSRTAAKMGYKTIRMGDVIRDEAQKQGKDVGEVAVNLRVEYGENIVAERCVEKIKKISKEVPPKSSNANDKFIIEGIRSPFEVEVFKNNFKGFKVVAIYSTPKTRFKRLKRRKRSDDSINHEDFIKRDKRELGFGIGDVIATSDYMIVNEGPLWKYKKALNNVFKRFSKR